MKSGVRGYHLRRNSTELEAPYFGMKLRLHSLWLAKLLFTSITFRSSVPPHCRQSKITKPFENLIKVSSLLFKVIKEIPGSYRNDISYFCWVNGLRCWFPMQKNVFLMYTLSILKIGTHFLKTIVINKFVKIATSKTVVFPPSPLKFWGKNRCQLNKTNLKTYTFISFCTVLGVLKVFL